MRCSRECGQRYEGSCFNKAKNDLTRPGSTATVVLATSNCRHSSGDKAMNQPSEQHRRRFLTKMAAGLLGTGAVTIGRRVSAVSAWTGSNTNSVLNQARPEGRAN